MKIIIFVLLCILSVPAFSQSLNVCPLPEVNDQQKGFQFPYIASDYQAVTVFLTVNKSKLEDVFKGTAFTIAPSPFGPDSAIILLIFSDVQSWSFPVSDSYQEFNVIIPATNNIGKTVYINASAELKDNLGVAIQAGRDYYGFPKKYNNDISFEYGSAGGVKISVGYTNDAGLSEDMININCKDCTSHLDNFVENCTADPEANKCAISERTSVLTSFGYDWADKSSKLCQVESDWTTSEVAQDISLKGKVMGEIVSIHSVGIGEWLNQLDYKVFKVTSGVNTLIGDQPN